MRVRVSSAAAVVDRHFSAIMYLVVIWGLLTWFCPLLVDFVALIFWNRRGHFVNMSHVRNFFNTADSIFVFLVLLTVVMMVTTVTVTGLFIYGKVKYPGARMPLSQKTFMRSTWFRVSTLVASIVLMMMVSVAAILLVVCADAGHVEAMALDAKYLPATPADVRMFRGVAKSSYEMGSGSPLTPDDSSVAGPVYTFLVSGVLMQSLDSSITRVFSNTTINQLHAQGKLYWRQTNGAASLVITTSELSSLLNSGELHIYEENSDGSMAVRKATYSYPSPPTSDTNSQAFHLARLGLTAVDAELPSVARHYLGAMGTASPTIQQVLSSGVSRAFQGGVAHAYLAIAQDSISRGYLFTGGPDSLHIDGALGYADSCYSMKSFAGGLFFFSFLTVMVVVATVFVLNQLSYMRNKRSSYSQVTAPLMGRSDGDGEQAEEYDDEFDDDDDYGSKWSSTAPLNEPAPANQLQGLVNGLTAVVANVTGAKQK